ncbi:MAG TPA: Wadjet anti-phage system protein JetD domain-containing protein [Polyangiales bacterium]|nr:Wadjet anti-phage system protein JetD domain-containing protein [Polyangiales bacterium]
MNERARWTTHSEIEGKLGKLWSSGRLLDARFASPEQAPLFPWQLRLRRPDVRALGTEFEAVQRWCRELEQNSKSLRGTGYEILWEEVNHRQLGRNRVPVAVVVQTEADAIALLGVADRVARLEQLVALTTASFPELLAWLSRSTATVLEHEADWTRVLAVLTWLRANPRPGIYLRQLEVPGVDSKFIEGNRAILSELLDLVLPTGAVTLEATGARQFELRYGILPKPPLVRFRMLDAGQQLGGLTDIATPASQFDKLDLDIDRVFITENEINGLAFPSCPRSIVLFGLGYGLTRLAEVRWLADKRIWYWGDLDTHGFAILDRLRAHLAHARSFLMDRETLMLHSAQWVNEPAAVTAELPRLHSDEAALYDDLRSNRIGAGIRLEQERIAYAWVRREVERITSTR